MQERKRITKKRILVVDDDHSSRVVLELLLRREGYDVQVTEDGCTALTLLKTESFDMILSDFLMPGMNGLEMAKAVRKIDETIPIILMSARVHLLEQEGIAQAGITQLLTKPFTREEMRTCLERYT